jgi:hypothetical protein
MSKGLKVTFYVDPEEMDGDDMVRLLDMSDRTGITNEAFEGMDTWALTALVGYAVEVETEVVDHDF